MIREIAFFFKGSVDSIIVITKFYYSHYGHASYYTSQSRKHEKPLKIFMKPKRIFKQ